MPDASVLIIDEHGETSEQLARRLGRVRGLRVVGCTANLELGAELARELKPDVILADFKRSVPPRAETYRWIAEISPGSAIVALTTFLADGEEQALKTAGVSKSLLKGIDLRELTAELIRLGTRRGGRPGDGG